MACTLWRAHWLAHFTGANAFGNANVSCCWPIVGFTKKMLTMKRMQRVQHASDQTAVETMSSGISSGSSSAWSNSPFQGTCGGTMSSRNTFPSSTAPIQQLQLLIMSCKFLCRSHPNPVKLLLEIPHQIHVIAPGPSFEWVAMVGRSVPSSV